MNILLLAFALPVATILLAIVLQKILRCPLLVAATFFAILLVITYTVFDSSFLVFAILYTILAYVTAVLTRLICNIIVRFNLNNCENCVCGGNENSNCNLERTGNCNVSSGTWRCTTRNVPRAGTNQFSANALTNNGRMCSNNGNSNGGNEPVIILTNANDIVNRNANERGTRAGRNCGCNCR